MACWALAPSGPVPTPAPAAPQLCLGHVGKLLPHVRAVLGGIWTQSYTVRDEGDDSNKGVSPSRGLSEYPLQSRPTLTDSRGKT